MKTKKLVSAALFAALCCALTIFPKIPAGNGYIHLGDSMVVLSGFVLGPVFGGTAAAIGSALADLFGGYVIYAPATFVIKFLTAAVSGLMLKKLPYNRFFSYITASLVGEAIMVLGYFLFELGLYGAAAAASIIPNTVQAASGIIAGTAIAVFLNKRLSKFFR